MKRPQNLITKEYRNLRANWNHEASYGSMKDDNNPIFIFSLTNTELLRQIASGKLDAKQLALIELDNRMVTL